MEELPEPVVAPHHVVVQPVYSLISSGTESASIHQEAILKEVAQQPSHLQKIWQAMRVVGPVRTFDEVRAKFSEFAVLGYAGAGVIVDRHSTVTDLDVGEAVAYGGEGTGHGEYVLVGRNVLARIPDGVSFEFASFTTLGSIALNAVRVAGIGLGDTVAVVGMGLVGQLVSQLARVHGGRVIAIDPRSDRLQVAAGLGAGHSFQPGEELTGNIAALTSGKGVDVVIVCAASKTSEPCRMAVEISRDRGRLVIVGAVELSFPWEAMYRKEIALLMARAYGPGSYDDAYEKAGRDYPYPYVRWTEQRNMEEFLRLLADGQLRVRELITHEFPLEQAAEAYGTILAPDSGSLAVVLRYPVAGVESVPSYRPKTKLQINAPAGAPAGSGRELRVGLVGAGNLAKWFHLPNLSKIPFARLHAVYSVNGARGKNYALRFGAAYACTDYEEMLRDPSIDVILIVSRNQHHAPQALAALQAGKHVFVEKPMALTAEECTALRSAVRETGLFLTVGFNRRFSEFYEEPWKKLRHRAGPVVANCRVSSPGISGSYWMADPSIGGAILGEACHFVDLLYWLIGAEPRCVSACSLPVSQTEPAGQNNIAAVFDFEDGSVASLTYCTVGSSRAAGERLEVFGPGISIVSEDFKRLTVHERLSRRSSRWFPEKGYMRQLREFLDGIRQGKPPAVTVDDGARATVACLRMLESARARIPLSVDWHPDAS